MTHWQYMPDRRLTPAEAAALSVTKACPACEGKLLRTAERMNYHPYQWYPNGYICGACNNMYLEIPTS
jgi:hypothetical protein